MMKYLIALLISGVLLFILPTNGFAGLDIFHSTNFVRYTSNTKKYFTQTSTSKIFLSAARNETVSFQIVLLDNQEAVNQVTLITNDLEGNSAFDKKHIDLFLLKNCQQSFLPDCLIPLQTGKKVLLKTTGKSTNHHVIWFDIHIPFRQHPGLYRGEIEFKLGTEDVFKATLELTVYPFQLPERPSLKADLNNYGVGFVKEWGYKVGSEKGYQIERTFYRFARKHRMIFNPLPYKSQRGNPHPTMAPKIEGHGENIHVSDWSEYDERYEPYFSGMAFENGIPIDHQYLSFNPEWPSGFSNYLNNRKVYEKEWEVIAKEFIRHFEEKGWEQTIFQIFPNQKPNSNNRIPWNLDEPKGVKDYEALRYYADLTHKVFFEESKIKIRFRMDISHFYCDKHRGNPLKDFRVNGGNKILSPVDIWAISKHSMDNRRPQEEAIKLKEQGKTLYEYMAGKRMPLIDDPLTKGIQYGWNAWLRREDGIIFWNTVKNMKKDSDGRNFLIYPGKEYGVDGPIASIRLKAIRRGIQDYEYIKLASEDERNIDSIVKNCNIKTPESYGKCRTELAEIILSKWN